MDVRAWSVIGLLVSLAAPSHAVVYDCVALQAKGSEPRSLAWAMNNKGHVAGQATFPIKGFSGGAAALWKQHDRAPKNLAADIEGMADSQAWDLNDRGQVVGAASPTCDQCDGERKPYLWQAGVSTELPMLTGGDWRSGEALSINNKGRIVGWNFIDGMTYAVLWRDGKAVNLPSLGSLTGQGQTPTTALFIDDDNVAVGSSIRVLGEGPEVAVRWDAKGRITELDGSVARGVNRAGTVVGQRNGQAVAWQNDKPVMLSVDADAGASIALHINESGSIVGSISTSAGTAAVVWPGLHQPSQKLTSLVGNACGLAGSFEFESANDILDNGQILVTGYREPFLRTAFVLTPR